MKFKKVISLVIATSMLSTSLLTGCGTKASPAPSPSKSAAVATPASASVAPSAKTGSAKKIVIFQSKVEISDQLQALAKDYQKETGVEVDVWGTTGDTYLQDLKTKLASNQGPTIFSSVPGAEEQSIGNYLADLSSLSFIKDIDPGLASSLNGKVVGIPYTVEGFGMVYNKSMIDPSKVIDSASFIKMLKDEKAKGINGFGLSKESYFLIGHILNTPFAVQKDPADFLKKLNAGQVKMADDPIFKEFAADYAAIRDNSYNPMEVDYNKETGDFATGKTAAIQQGNWCYSQFKDFKLDSSKIGLMPFPLAGNNKLAVSVPAVWHVNSQVSAEEQQAGKDFLNWLYTSDTGKKYLMDQFGFIPVVKGMQSTSLDPLSKDVQAYTEKGNIITWSMNDWPAGIVDVYLLPVAQKFFTSKMTPDEFLKELDKAWASANAKK